MTPKTIFLVIITALLSLNAVAQYGETIRSGRPGQAIGPFAVGKNVFQVQAGNDWSKLEDKRTQLTGTANSTDGVFRYGLTEHFEISSAISFLQENFEQNNTKSSNKGINSFGIRMRSNVYVGKELVPTIGFQFNLNLPIVNEIYQADYIAPKIMMMTGQSFNNFSFVSNWGIAWNGNDANPQGVYVLNLGYSITDQLGIFIENYGTLQNQKTASKFDGGFSWLVNNDLQLDLLGGYDKNGTDYTDWFVSAGVSWRIKMNAQ